MHRLTLKIPKNPYEIIIGEGVLSKIGEISKKLDVGNLAVIITNPGIAPLYGSKILASMKRHGISGKILLVPDGEKSKSAQMALKLIDRISRLDAQRRIFIVALGGGVVGDLAGFVASIYKRGIPYLQVPTTLLAQVDSAIGGKVAIDLPVGKNLVGAYYHPRLVLSDIAVLKTLKPRQIRNGLAEVIKYGIISGRGFFGYLEKNYPYILSLDSKHILEVVKICSFLKADIVKQDEREKKGIRTQLNFGHTIGHAIEAASHYGQYQHGEAISIGIQAAADLSVALGYLDLKSSQRIEQLIEAVGLPSRIRGISLSTILKMMQHDKKFSGGRNRFVLAEEIGRVRVVEGIPPTFIKKAILKRMA